MSAGEVRTRDEAIVHVDQALSAWTAEATGLLTQAQSIALAAKTEVDMAVSRRANAVAAIEARLSAADRRERQGFEARLATAQEALEEARRASAQVAEVVAGASRLHRSHVMQSVPHVEQARAHLSVMSQALDGYRVAGGSLGGTQAQSTSGSHRSHAPSTPAGLVDLDVSAADLESSPVLDDDRSRGTFGKGGLSRADYRWAVQTWNDTVGPAVQAGKERDHFVERDAQSGAKPLRRTADVYDMFQGSDRIRADRMPGGRLDIINGRHRLLIARELGIKTLPGEVL